MQGHLGDGWAMKRILARLLALSALAAAPAIAQAQSYVIETIEIIEIEDDGGSERTIGIAPQLDYDLSSTAVIASYGPFHVVDPQKALLDGTTDSASPDDFAHMLRDFPAIGLIEMGDCPGTVDDVANLQLARMIRRAGIATHVPDGGSVRSGAVELFLAGARRSAAPQAEFAVHSWRDEDGLEADDYASGDPVHTAYIDFYREMGMTPANARAFYAMTNQAPHDDARWLGPAELARYGALTMPSVVDSPRPRS